MSYTVKFINAVNKKSQATFKTLKEAERFKRELFFDIDAVGKIYNNNTMNSRKRKVSTGSKSRVSSKTKRKNLYDWAWKQKGKGSISRIGKKMKSLSKTKGLGAKVAVRQLGRIGDLKAAFNAGVKSRKR